MVRCIKKQFADELLFYWLVIIGYTESVAFFASVVESARTAFFGTTGSSLFGIVFMSGLGVFG